MWASNPAFSPLGQIHSNLRSLLRSRLRPVLAVVTGEGLHACKRWHRQLLQLSAIWRGEAGRNHGSGPGSAWCCTSGPVQKIAAQPSLSLRQIWASLAASCGSAGVPWRAEATAALSGPATTRWEPFRRDRRRNLRLGSTLPLIDGSAVKLPPGNAEL